ncbi:MAG: phage major capsid protein, partial [Burkholderiales bacterium]|nr:phage major capsid protein [Burkholderiales bacterium]
DVEAKLAKINDAIVGLEEKQSKIIDEIKLANRPGNGGDNTAREVELKSFRSYPGARCRLASADELESYKSAFGTFVRKQGIIDLLSDEERKSMQTGIDTDGGYLMPPAVVNSVVKRLENESVIRSLASQVTISTMAIEGLVDRGRAVAGWTGETQARPKTATPEVGKDRIVAEEMYAYPDTTQTLLEDAAIDIEAWLADKVADAFLELESDAFINGSGVVKPKGLFAYGTAATGDKTRPWGTFQHVATGQNGDFASSDPADKLIELSMAPKTGYLANARWLMNRSVLLKIRQFKDGTTDQYLLQPGIQAGTPPTLLGYPISLDENVPTLGTGSLSLAFGDFRRAYMVVDRLGMTLLRDPYTDKPRIGLYFRRRVGGSARDYDAVKFMKFGS